MSAEGQMVVGAVAIGKFLGITERQVRSLVEHNRLPVFRTGRLICSTPDDLRLWVKDQRRIAGINAVEQAKRESEAS